MSTIYDKSYYTLNDVNMHVSTGKFIETEIPKKYIYDIFSLYFNFWNYLEPKIAVFTAVGTVIAAITHSFIIFPIKGMIGIIFTKKYIDAKRANSHMFIKLDDTIAIPEFNKFNVRAQNKFINGVKLILAVNYKLLYETNTDLDIFNIIKNRIVCELNYLYNEYYKFLLNYTNQNIKEERYKKYNEIINLINKLMFICFIINSVSDNVEDSENSIPSKYNVQFLIENYDKHVRSLFNRENYYSRINFVFRITNKEDEDLKLIKKCKFNVLIIKINKFKFRYIFDGNFNIKYNFILNLNNDYEFLLQVYNTVNIFILNRVKLIEINYIITQIIKMYELCIDTIIIKHSEPYDGCLRFDINDEDCIEKNFLETLSYEVYKFKLHEQQEIKKDEKYKNPEIKEFIIKINKQIDEVKKMLKRMKKLDEVLDKIAKIELLYLKIKRIETINDTVNSSNHGLVNEENYKKKISNSQHEVTENVKITVTQEIAELKNQIESIHFYNPSIEQKNLILIPNEMQLAELNNAVNELNAKIITENNKEGIIDSLNDDENDSILMLEKSINELNSKITSINDINKKVSLINNEVIGLFISEQDPSKKISKDINEELALVTQITVNKISSNNILFDNISIVIKYNGGEIIFIVPYTYYHKFLSLTDIKKILKLVKINMISVIHNGSLYPINYAKHLINNLLENLLSYNFNFENDLQGNMFHKDTDGLFHSLKIILKTDKDIFRELTFKTIIIKNSYNATQLVIRLKEKLKLTYDINKSSGMNDVQPSDNVSIETIANTNNTPDDDMISNAHMGNTINDGIDIIPDNTNDDAILLINCLQSINNEQIQTINFSEIVIKPKAVTRGCYKTGITLEPNKETIKDIVVHFQTRPELYDFKYTYDNINKQIIFTNNNKISDIYNIMQKFICLKNPDMFTEHKKKNKFTCDNICMDGELVGLVDDRPIKYGFIDPILDGFERQGKAGINFLYEQVPGIAYISNLLSGLFGTRTMYGGSYKKGINGTRFIK
jgi:hypothetical protein